jgi:hypothetical protein
MVSSSSFYLILPNISQNYFLSKHANSQISLDLTVAVVFVVESSKANSPNESPGYNAAISISS